MAKGEKELATQRGKGGDKNTKCNRYWFLNLNSVPALLGVLLILSHRSHQPYEARTVPVCRWKADWEWFARGHADGWHEELWLDPIPWTQRVHHNTLTLSLSLFMATLGTPGSQLREKRSPFPSVIIIFLSPCRWGCLSGCRGSALEQLCHALLRNTRPASWYEAIWLVTTSWKQESVQMFCCNIGPQTSHMTPFQPKSPFIVNARKPATLVPSPKREAEEVSLRVR